MEFKIGEWIIRPRHNELIGAHKKIRVEARIMAVLEYLCDNSGRIVSHQELVKNVWHKEALSRQSVSVAIAALRRALGDDVKNPTYIQTISKKGYCLLTPPKQNISPLKQRRTWLPKRGARAAMAAILCAVLISPTLFQNDETVITDSITVHHIANATGKPEVDIVATSISELVLAEMAQYKTFSVRQNIAPPFADSLLDINEAKRYVVWGRLFSENDGFLLALNVVNEESAEVVWAKTEVLETENYYGAVQSLTSDFIQELSLLR